MKKICYFNLITYSKTGGIESYNKTFLKALDGLDFKVTSVSVYDKEDIEMFKNVDIKNFDASRVKASLYVLRNISKIKKLIIAHLNLLPIAIIGKILNPKVEIYLSIYGIEVWKKLPLLYRAFLSKIKILSISTYTTSEFKSLNSINNDKVFYLPPAIDTKINNKFSNIYNNYEFNILSVARLESHKGIDNILKSIPFLVKHIPNLKYTIIGNGKDRERLEILVKKLNLNRYVEFKGFVKHIEPYYQYCDVFVLPSNREGFGIVYIEAMKYKKPCIACDVGGQTDVVIDNKTGFLCEYGNLECLKEKILKLYKDKNLSAYLGDNGYKYLIENFTFEKFKERLMNILNA